MIEDKLAPPDLAVEIRMLLTLVTKLTMRDLEQRLGETMPGLSLLQFGVLRLLAREQCTLTELSAKMMLTPSTLVPVVDKLERDGLVVRGKDPHDRRRTPLMVTEQASGLLIAIPASHPDDMIAKCIGEMGEHKARQLHKLLHDLLLRMSPDRDVLDDVLKHHPDWDPTKYASKKAGHKAKEN